MDLIVVLIAVAGVLVLIDVFIPTFGLLTVSAVGLIVWAHVLAFRRGFLTGVLCLLATLAYLGLDALVAYHYARRSSLIHRGALSQDEAPGELRTRLLDAEGVTETPLRPSGKVKIDGAVYDAKCDVSFVDAHRPVRVVGVRGSQLNVKPVNSDSR